MFLQQSAESRGNRHLKYSQTFSTFHLLFWDILETGSRVFPIMPADGWASTLCFSLWILSALSRAQASWQHIAAPLIRSNSRSKQTTAAYGRHISSSSLTQTLTSHFEFLKQQNWDRPDQQNLQLLTETLHAERKTIKTDHLWLKEAEQTEPEWSVQKIIYIYTYIYTEPCDLYVNKLLKSF